MKKKRLTKKMVRELRNWVLELLIMSRDDELEAQEMLKAYVQSGDVLLRMRQIHRLITEYRRFKAEAERYSELIRTLSERE